MRLHAYSLVAVLSIVPLGARAENRPSMLADHAPGAPPATLELEVGLYVDSDEDGDSVTSIPITLSGSYRPSEHVELELDWPFAYFDASPDVGDGFSEFQSGNPFAAVYYVGPMRTGYFRIGAGLAPPLASVDTDDLTNLSRDVLPLALASAVHGFWDIWLHSLDRFSLVLPALQIESQSDALLLGAEGAIAVLITTDDTVNSDTDIVLQAAGLIGAAFDQVTLGTRLQVVFQATQEIEDDAQLALVPFVQVQLGRSGFLYTRFVMTLDEPLGVFGDGDNWAWSLNVGGGGRF